MDANTFRNRATGALAGFSAGQRVVVVVAVLTLVAGGVFFAQWASKPTLVPLFTNLESSDAAAITDKLSSQNVPYELTDQGHTVMVPQSQVYQLRLDMSSAGLPTGGSEGYKLLDKQGITTSEFRQHVDYQRALEGELAKTIGAIDGVNAAAVHLVIPKQDVFADDASKPSASVLIKTTPGKSLGGQQVRAVVNLVASSVEGLEPSNVTVADDKGRVLAAPGQELSGGDNDAQNEATTSLEDSLTQKIQSMLTPLLGEGKAVVQARAELNFDKSASTTEIWNPSNREAPATSSHEVVENYTGTNPNTTGILGPDGTATDGSTDGNYEKSDITRDFGVDRQVTQSEQAPGKIDRISVAVLLDSNVPNMDPQEIERLVTDAAGLSTARGDTVTVSQLPFDNTQATVAAEELKAAEKVQQQEQLMSIIKTAGTFLIILAVLIILFITTKRRGARTITSTPISMAELDAMRPAALSSADDMLGALDGRTPSFELDSPEAQERAKVDKEITDLIEKQPDEVAQLLRSWLADRRT